MTAWRWLKCPHHGPLCGGRLCCCRDRHWRPLKVRRETLNTAGGLMPEFQDDLVFRVDFNNYDETNRFVRGSLDHGSSRRIPRRMERVLLHDGEGNRCWAWVHDVRGVKLWFDLDDSTWVSGELDGLVALDGR